MLYPRQPHMHVCLFSASALFQKSTYTNTHKLQCVCPCIPSECASLWVGGEGSRVRGLRERERRGEMRGSRGRSSPTLFSLHRSLHLQSFPPFVEPSKESLSPASQLQSSSVRLCHRVCVSLCVYLCVHVFLNICQ